MIPASRSSRRRLAAALLLVLGPVMAGCGSQDATAGTQPAPSSTAMNTADASSTSTAQPAESGSPDVTPASGPRLRADGVSFRVPKGWADVTEETAATVVLAADLGADERPDMLRVERLGDAPANRERLARAAAASLAKQYRSVRVEAPTRVGGAPAVHLSAVGSRPGEQVAVDRYDVVTPTGVWSVTFSLNRWLVKADRQRTVASVLETFVWG